MRKHLILILLFIVSFGNDFVYAQTTRSLTGRVNLDVGPSDKNRMIEITVNNHSFVVIPPNFTILRPITSSRSTLVMLPARESSFTYLIDSIIFDPSKSDPVDYSVALTCIGCSGDIPTQYYSPAGNKFGLTNSTFIDPDDLPPILNFTATTRASIIGTINLNKPSSRGLSFTATIFSAQNPQQIFKTVSNIILPLGASNISYSVTGLNRNIGSDQYRIKVVCTNCFGQSRRAQVFANELSPNMNHTDINFAVTDLPPISIAPIIELILH